MRDEKGEMRKLRVSERAGIYSRTQRAKAVSTKSNEKQESDEYTEYAGCRNREHC